MEMEEHATTIQIDAQVANEDELLSMLIKKGILELKPSLDKSGIHYAAAEEAWGLDLVQTKEALTRLEKKGFLKVEILDRVLTCPKCSSPEVHSKYTCPRCKSYNVEFTELFEHLKCGNIASKDSFMKGSSLVCPRCQADLVKEATDYRVIGNFFQCEKCGHRFDKPDVIHRCQNCGATSTYQDAKYIRLFVYKMTDEVAKILQREMPILKNAKKILIDKGFRVQMHAKIAGASGVQCPFDILAEKDGVRIVMDISTTGNKSDIVALLAKKVDVSPTEAVVLDLSNLDELANLGKVFGITVFKIPSSQDSPEGFLDLLNSLGQRLVQKKSPRTKGG